MASGKQAAGCRLQTAGPRASLTPGPWPLAPARGRRRGFTLTELLVVIAIIAMLVALTSVAVIRAIETARQTRVKSELDQLDMALKAFKDKYGAYPPCDLRYDPNVTTPPAVAAIMQNPRLRQFIARAFPRYNLTPTGLVNDLRAAGVDTVNFRPDQALVFWLRGFSPNPANPFVAQDDTQIINGQVITGGMRHPKVKRTQFFEFDASRLATRDTLDATPRMMTYGPVLPSYFPQVPGLQTTPSTATSPFSAVLFAEWSGGPAPYVYFDANSYGNLPEFGPPLTPALPNAFNTTVTTLPNTPMPLVAQAPFDNAGTAVPYWLDSNGNMRTHSTGTPPPSDFDTSNDPIENWANPESFQIIAPGSDGKYGVFVPSGSTVEARLYPTGAGYDLAGADDDNVTNFCDRARLGDAKP